MSTPLRRLSELQQAVRAGELSRRDVLRTSLGLGLSAPVIAGLLAACGGDDDDDVEEPGDAGGSEDPTATEAVDDEPTEDEGESEDEPTEPDEEPDDDEEASGEERGGGGKIVLLYWQAPVILNPHFAQGQKDYDASRIVLEPLFDLDVNTEPVLVLADEWPTIDNGLLDPDGMFVTWKLKQGIKWHDGEEFTAEDVRFTWEFVTHEDSSATTVGSYAAIDSVEVIDTYTVQVNYTNTNPNWMDGFSGNSGMILPEHLLRDYVGEAARDAPYNLMPIGTGPWKVTDFRPDDVALYEINDEYWEPGVPFFDEVELKGGGDAASAARAVLVTGEADYANNLQVEPEVLNQMVESGQGEVIPLPHNNVERIYINFANPREEVDGAFSEPSTEHPIWKFKEARQALDLAVNRDAIQQQLYPNDVTTPYILNVPEKFKPPGLTWEYDLDKARELLESIGFPDDFESTDILYPTTTNAVRQKNQEVVKQDLEALGFNVEIKSVPASVFLSSDAGNPDTYGHFYADIEMFGNGPSSPYPIAFTERFRSDRKAQKSNDWSGPNYMRYHNPAFDEIHDRAQTEMDEEAQIELFHQMMTMVWEDVVEIPIVWKSILGAVHNRIQVGRPEYSFNNWAPKPVAGLKYWSLK